MKSNDIYFLSIEDRPDWVIYPASFCRLVEQGLLDIRPWHIMKAHRTAMLYQGLAQRYPYRTLFPFAYRQDNDDVACWAKGAGERVFVIHDLASPGWEDEGLFDDVWSWFRSAVDDTIAWD